MSALKKFCLVLLAGVSFSTVSVAESTAPILRRLTLSLGYDEQYNSNEGLKHLPLTGMQMYSWLFDKLGQLATTPLQRVGMLLGDFVLHTPYMGESAQDYWLLQEKWWPYLPAYHEFGHARAARAFTKNGFSHYRLVINGDETQKQSILWYYFHSLKHMAFNQVAETNFTVRTMTNPVRDAALFGGGLNNEARLTKEIAEWVYRNNGHVSYFWPYLRGKLGVVTYTYKTLQQVVLDDTGDVGHLYSYYKRYYENFNLNRVIQGGVASIFLSSSTYAFLNGFYNYVLTGDPTVKTFTWKGIRIPDVNMYFTRNGLSFEAVTGYQINPNFWLNVSVECPFYPKAFHSVEVTPSVRYILHTSQYGQFDFDAGVVMNTFGYFSGFAGVEWTDPVNPVTFGAKLIHHNANTYVGERNIPNALDSDHDVELMMTVSVNY